MKTIFATSISALLFLSVSCNSNDNQFDATGTFEATEITISSEIPGRITSFNINEGDSVLANSTIGMIDTVQLYLSKLQLEKNINSVKSNRPVISTQVAALREQIDKQIIERNRVEKLLSAKAATQKQLDDINSAIKVLNSQLSAMLSTLNNNTSSIDAQSSAIEIQIAQVNDKLSKCRIYSPIKGVILNKYAEQGELANMGQPLFKVADIENIFLRAYITSSQLASIKIGQKVKVFAHFGGDNKKEYQGTISWISQKSEFTPKSIQTHDERSNLVYAVKIAVKNDGIIKLGMYGEVIF